MAGQRRKRRAVQLTETATPAAETQEKKQPPVSSGRQRFTFWDYLLVNVFFWVFCWLQRTVAEILNGDDMGLNFFFYTMAAGFTAVSIVAFVHDWLTGEDIGESEL